MVERAQFVNVKINVDGKIHNVKVEKGVTFNSCFVMDDNKVVKYVQDKSYPNEYTLSTKYGSGVKMSKDEFTVFKNFADNVKENGNEIILSKGDIVSAEELFRAGNFTKDISKNLTGCADKGSQDIEYAGSLPQYRTYLEAKENVIIANVDGQSMLYSTGDIHCKQVRDFVNDSKNGKIHYERDESSAGYDYIDKKGIKHRYSYDDNDKFVDYQY